MLEMWSLTLSISAVCKMAGLVTTARMQYTVQYILMTARMYSMENTTNKCSRVEFPFITNDCTVNEMEFISYRQSIRNCGLYVAYTRSTTEPTTEPVAEYIDI